MSQVWLALFVDGGNNPAGGSRRVVLGSMAANNWSLSVSWPAGAGRIAPGTRTIDLRACLMIGDVEEISSNGNSPEYGQLTVMVIKR